MLFITVLICSSTLAPDECTPHTARAFQAFVGQGIICGVAEQAMIAARATKPGEGEYQKVRCALKR